MDLLFGLFAGLGPGAVFAILGAGLVIAYRGSGVINFAHGSVAAYAAYTWNELRAVPSGSVGYEGGSIFLPWFDPIPEWGFLKALHINNLPVEIHIMVDPPAWFAILVTLLMSAFIGLLMHLLVFRPLRNSPLLAKVVGSVGIMIYLQAIASVNFGAKNRSDYGFWEFSSTAEPITNFLGMGKNLPRSTPYLAISALIVGAIVWLIYRYTRFGLSTRAADENEKGATLLGYSPQFLAGLNWVISSVLAGLAGVLFVHKAQPSQLSLYIVAALAAALVGNLTSIPGAIFGGLGLGAIASMGVSATNYSWWPEWLPPEGIRAFAPVLVVIIVLYLRGDKLPIRGTVGLGKQPLAPSTKHPFVGIGIGAFAVLLMSNIFTSKWESTLTTTLIAIMFMLSLVVLLGFLGQISLVQWSLAGVASFVLIRLSSSGVKVRSTDFFVVSGPDWPDPLAALGGVAAAVILGLLIGIPALKIRGLQLAVITLVSIVAVEDLVMRNKPIMGVASVTTNPTPEPKWFGQYIGALDESTYRNDYWKYTFFALVVVSLASLLVVNLRRGLTGRRFLAIRSNERAAAAAGVNVARTKMLGFGVSSFLAGLAGMLIAYKLPMITSENFSPLAGLAMIAFAYIGGITTVTGAVLGGILVGGGLISEFSSLHFEGITRSYINVVGAVGLIVTAIFTSGEGTALSVAKSAKAMVTGMRDSSEEPNIVEEIHESIEETV